MKGFFVTFQYVAVILETITQCPLCGNNTFKPFLTCKDYLITSQEFSIQQCQKCSFRLTSPRPDSASIGNYYKSNQYVSHNDSGGGLINAAYRMVRNRTLQTKLELINRLNRGTGKLLDVGCGTGAFLDTCQQAGWIVSGTEPDSDALAITEQKLKITIHQTIETLPKKTLFDVITLWHVLEHVADLNVVIPQLGNLLSDAGTMIIAVPNSASYDATYFKQFWAAYDVPRHLHHFTPTTIQPLFKKHGLELVETLPMIFDAYYIALLSTKYQSGKTDYLKSIRMGLQSNNKAKKTGQYSSLIYIFRKAKT